MKTLIPEGAKRIPARPLALGEVTGHHHSIVSDEADCVEMFEDASGNVFVRLTEDAPLQHQEHKGAVVPAGVEFGVRIATEVNAWGERQNVAD